MIRFGKFLQPRPPFKPFTSDAKYLLYAIPQAAIDANNKLKQNDGYEPRPFKTHTSIKLSPHEEHDQERFSKQRKRIGRSRHSLSLRIRIPAGVHNSSRSGRSTGK